MPLTRRPLTIRATLTAIAAGACAYVGLIGVYIGLVLAPAATGLHDRTDALEQQFGALQDRVTILKDTLREAERASQQASLSAQDLDRIRDLQTQLTPVAKVSAGMLASQRLFLLSPDMRGLLADSADAESRFAGLLQEALDHLVRGDLEGARRRLADGGQARDTLIANLSETQRQGLADMVATERQLAARATQVGRVIGVWTLMGIVPIGLVMLAVRRRLYIPLEALDSGLARVATGDFSTPLPVLRDDEVGRLTAQLNQTMALLQARADEAQSRQSSLAERLGRRSETIRLATHRISDIALSPAPDEQLFEEIHKVVAGLIRADNFYIALHDAEHGMLSFPYYIDEFDQTPGPQPVGRGMTEYVLRTGKAILVTPEVFDGLAEQGEVERLGAPSVDWVGVPLVADNQTIGVFVVQSYHEGQRYTQEDVEILQFVSVQVAMAVARRRADRALRESQDRLQADIAERKRAELALQRERDLVARIADTSPVGITVLDRNGRITFANGQAARTLGITPEELRQRRFDTPNWRITQYDGSPFPEDELPFRRVMATGQPVFNVGHAIESADGRRVLLSINGAPLFDEHGAIEGVVAAVTDVTERVHLEEQFRQAQKMESIGRLAGGVAHDFNNLLTVMLGFTAQAKSALQDDDPAKLDLDEVENACHRAAALTRQLLAFARRQVIDPRALDLNVTTQSMDKMLRRLIGEDIELVTVPGDGLWTVWADPGQIQQVLANLVVNARDAMPQGGRLTVETRNVTLDAGYAARHPDVVPGDYVMLAVTDTGHGMAPEVAARVFEPFFTTKRSGIGTGLGLATCYGIAKQAGGSIWVSSEPGRGSTFELYLPRVNRIADAAPAAQLEAAVGGVERILLVEDEDNVRKIAARTLRDAGYTVLEASNGEDALLVVADRLDSIDLVVTDVVMPQMGGRDLAERLLALRPDLKILFTSGYTEDGIVHRGVLDRGVSFLPKPYDRAALTRRVRSMLDGTPP